MKKLLKYLDDKISEVIKIPIGIIIIMAMFAFIMSYVGALEIEKKLSDSNNTPEFKVLCERVLLDGYVSMNELDEIRHKYLDQ